MINLHNNMIEKLIGVTHGVYRSRMGIKKRVNGDRGAWYDDDVNWAVVIIL